MSTGEEALVGVVVEQSPSHCGPWLGADCRQLMQVKAAALTPHTECFVSGQGRENGLATPAELLIACWLPSIPTTCFLHA